MSETLDRTKMTPAQLKHADILFKVAGDLQVDVKLLAAIITAESSWLPTAVQYEINYPYLYKTDYFAKLNHITEGTEIILQKCSWGLGQVMGGKAREFGYASPLQGLCDPYVGMYYCALNLRKLASRYASRDDQIAAYNAGSVIMNGKEYKNQDYVDRVKKYYT